MKKITFEEAIEEYLNYLKLKDKEQSIMKIKNRINLHILPYLKEQNIFEFTKKDYIDWQIEISKHNYKYSYKKTIHYCFVSFLNFCIKFLDLDRNVASIVGNFKNNDIIQKGNILELEEFNKFISTVDNIIFKNLFCFLYFTGARIGEALALNWNDINFYNNTIYINKTITKELYNGNKIISNPKTKSSTRYIMLDDHMIKDLYNLKIYYEKNDTNFNNNYYIFGGIKTLSITTITRYKNKYCDLSKVKRIKLHEFRHSHACLLYMNDVPISEISNRLGHSNISITIDTYLRNLPNKEKRVISTLNHLRLN